MQKEKGTMTHFMNFLKWFIIVVVAIGIVVRAAVEWKNSNGRKAPLEKLEQKSKPVSEENKQNTEAEKEKLIQLQAEANRLDSAMQLLVGGSRGLLVCRRIAQEDKRIGRAETYRESFLKKQGQLKKLYSQYEILKQEAPALYPLENEALYRELMEEQL